MRQIPMSSYSYAEIDVADEIVLKRVRTVLGLVDAPPEESSDQFPRLIKMEIIPFGSQDLDDILAREPKRAHYLPFGAVMLDRFGKILIYNKAEGLITNRNADDMIGKDFFNDAAPCAKGKRFHGEFLKFQRSGQIDVMFDFTFAYKGADVAVKIHLKSQPDGQNCWMFAKRT